MSKKFTLVLFMLPLLALSSLSLLAQNSSLSFNSTSTSFAIADPGVNPVPTPFSDATIELWVFVPSSQPGQHMFVSQGDTTTSFYIGYDGSASNQILLGDQWPGGTGVPLPIGQWNHIAVVVNGSTFNATLFLNGIQAATTVGQIGLDGSYFTCGGGHQLTVGTDADTIHFFNGRVDQLRIWNVQRTALDISRGMYHPLSSTTGLLAAYSFDEGTGTVAANSTATTGQDLTLQASVSWLTSPVVPGNNALLFNGTNSQVNIAASAAYDIAHGTVEAYIQPTGTEGTIGGATGTILGNRGAGGARYSFHINTANSPHTLGLWNNGAYMAIPFTPGFTTDGSTWYHIAWVVDASVAEGHDTTGVYVDGNYIGKIDEGFGNLTGQEFAIGISRPGNTEPFIGGIDEVRIWSVPRTQTEIQANMGNTLAGNEANLAAVWSFDNGIANGDNTGLVTTTDNAAGNNGTLANFALTAASSSNYVTHVLVPLPITLAKFTVTKVGTTALLQWQTAQEENSKDFIIERSGSGANFTDIGSVPAAGTTHSVTNYTFTDNDPIEGKNYYRLKELDLDGKPTYSPVKVLAFTKTGGLIWYSTGAKSVEVRLQKGSSELYSITDASGHLIRKGNLSGGVTSLAQLPAGIYFVKVVLASGSELNTKVLLP